MIGFISRTIGSSGSARRVLCMSSGAVPRIVSVA
jgi:hypothetical protein